MKWLIIWKEPPREVETRQCPACEGSHCPVIPPTSWPCHYSSQQEIDIWGVVPLHLGKLYHDSNCDIPLLISTFVQAFRVSL